MTYRPHNEPWSSILNSALVLGLLAAALLTPRPKAWLLFVGWAGIAVLYAVIGVVGFWFNEDRWDEIADPTDPVVVKHRRPWFVTCLAFAIFHMIAWSFTLIGWEVWQLLRH